MHSAPAATREGRRIRKSRLFGNQFVGYVYLLPAFVFYTLFVILPALRTFYWSFFGSYGLKITQFVGLQNYRALLSDPLFFESVKHNIVWAAIMVSLPVIFGLLLAVLLAEPWVVGRTVFRVLLFLPQVIKSVVVAMIWRWMYNPVFGPVNEALRLIGLGSVARGWLGDSTWALPALALGRSWAYYAFCMVLFLAALQGIDETLYDAAKIDGANASQRFRYVTLPQMKFVIVTVLLFTLIDSFKIFDMIYIATQGGPGYSTWVMSIYLYDFVWYRWKFAHGVTTAAVHTLWVAALTALLTWWRRRIQVQQS